MNSTISVINEFPSTKETLEMFVAKTVAEVDCGNINALELKSQLKFIEKAIEEIDKKTKESQLRELAKYPKGPNDIYGFKVEQMEVGTKYDYESTGDEQWKMHKQLADASIKGQKDREAFLRTLKDVITIVDVSTGEVNTIYPPVKSSTTSLKFTMK